MRGADLLAAALVKAGVTKIFSLSGNQIMPVYDACFDTDIQLYHVRHEGAAPYMADAYAQITGEVGIALITAGPGFANGLSGLYSARQAESPLVLLSGDAPLSMAGRGAFQEMDQVAISAPLTKYSFRSQRAEDLGNDLAKAMRIAKSGRPGPVHLALPFDLLNADVGAAMAPDAADFEAADATPPEAAINAIADAIAAAARPVILTGGALNPTRAQGLLQRLAETLDTPVVPMESPRGLIDPCLGDIASALAEADLIVALGKRLDFTTNFAAAPAFAADAKLILVEPEAEEMRRSKLSAGERLMAAHDFSPALAGAALAAGPAVISERTAWRERIAQAIAARTPEPVDAAMPMHPAQLCAAVQRLLDQAEDPILVVDGGEFGQWAQACITAPTRVINGASGSIGGALSYAIAAQIARPQATVVVLMGDGTVGFHFAELETAHRYGANIITVIGHDARWNAEYQIQKNAYGAERINEVELNRTRYDQAATGLGCFGIHVEDPAELDSALAAARAAGLPACLTATIEGLPAPSGSGH